MGPVCKGIFAVFRCRDETPARGWGLTHGSGFPLHLSSLSRFIPTPTPQHPLLSGTPYWGAPAAEPGPGKYRGGPGYRCQRRQGRPLPRPSPPRLSRAAAFTHRLQSGLPLALLRHGRPDYNSQHPPRGAGRGGVERAGKLQLPVGTARCRHSRRKHVTAARYRGRRRRRRRGGRWRPASAPSCRGGGAGLCGEAGPLGRAAWLYLKQSGSLSLSLSLPPVFPPFPGGGRPQRGRDWLTDWACKAGSRCGEARGGEGGEAGCWRRLPAGGGGWPGVPWAASGDGTVLPAGRGLVRYRGLGGG